MSSKVLAFLALATVANANDVIVGLKTDGTKIFDENRQANPALWRQIDNVTIKAPENEVIRRVVITDLRPDKDGDVKIVEGGEGQKNVTIELKSPTVLRGYEFHIEVYSAPEENVPFTDDQQSTTEVLQDASTEFTSSNPTTELDASKVRDFSTDKIAPAILVNDEVKESDRQGRNAKNENNNASEVTTDLASTTLKNDASTSTTQTDSTTENHSEKTSDNANKFDHESTIPISFNRNFNFPTSETPNKFEHESTVSPTPLNKNFNIPIVPGIIGKDDVNDKFNLTSNTDRHVRDTAKEISEPTKVELNPEDIESDSTESEEETTTTDVIPIEEKSEDNDKEVQFSNRKYTSVIASKIEHPHNPIEASDSEKLRNVRKTNEQMTDSTTFTSDESTTTELNDETTTLSSEDCITTESTNVQVPNNNEAKIDPIPVYVNNRQWDQRFNNPTFSRDSQNAPGLKLYPAVLTHDQSTNSGSLTPEVSSDPKP